MSNGKPDPKKAIYLPTAGRTRKGNLSQATAAKDTSPKRGAIVRVVKEETIPDTTDEELQNDRNWLDAMAAIIRSAI